MATPNVYGHAGWRKIRERIFERDGRVCQKCGETRNLVIDHIVPVRESLMLAWDESNLRVLCRSCNMKRSVGRPKHIPTPPRPSRQWL